MTQLFGRTWTRSQLEARYGDFSQIAGVDLVTFGDGAARGVRTLLFRTGSGLEFSVLIDRAFDIGRCRFRGIELGWQSPVGIRSPWLHEVNDEGGASFHRSFSGFLITAGLDHTGAAFREPARRYFAPDRNVIEYPLHGRLMAIPGQLVGYGHEWRGDHCILFCEGLIKQVAVFGENLLLTRRYEAQVGASSFTIRDRVRNQAFYKTPHMLLYHINLGFPLLDDGSEFIAPTRGVRWAMRDSRAEGINYHLQTSPRTDCVEQVYVHEAVEDAHGLVRAALINRNLEGGLGVAVEFNKKQLPFLMQWQNFQAGSYCMAIEPSTSHALGRPYAEAHDGIAWLEHGEERTYDVRLSVLSSPDEVASFEAIVRQLVQTPADPLGLPQEELDVDHSSS